MDASSPKPSIYERFMGGFVRKPHGELLHSFGPSQSVIRSSWTQIQHQTLNFQHLTLEPDQPLRTDVGVDVKVDKSGYEDAKTVPRQLALYELPLYEHSAAYHIGIALTLDPASKSTADVDHDLFFASLILSGTHLSFRENGRYLDGTDYRKEYLENTTDAIVDHFNTSLRYIAEADMWEHGGRECFRNRIWHFVSKGNKKGAFSPRLSLQIFESGKGSGKIARSWRVYCVVESLQLYTGDRTDLCARSKAVEH